MKIKMPEKLFILFLLFFEEKKSIMYKDNKI